jgi:hypothetical protein
VTIADTPAAAKPTKRCAKCKAAKPLDAFDDGRKNCRECAAEGARKGPRHPKPEGWKAPKPGETPMKRCAVCQAEKVWQAFPDHSDACRECAAGEQEPAPKEPVAYTSEIGERIAELIASRVPMHEIAAMPGMPSDTTIYKWRRQHPEFAEAMEIAREHRADARADRVDAYIADLKAGKLDAHSARVLIESELRLAAKEHPARYGEKVTSDITLRPGKAGPDKPDTAAWLDKVLGASAVASNVVPLLPAPGDEEDAA